MIIYTLYINYIHETIFGGEERPAVTIGDFIVNLMETSSERVAVLRNLIDRTLGVQPTINEYTTDYHDLNRSHTYKHCASS